MPHPARDCCGARTNDIETYDYEEPISFSRTLCTSWIYVKTEAERSGLIPITLVQNPNGKRKDAALETATYITRLQEGPMSTCIPMKWVKWANQAQIRE